MSRLEVITGPMFSGKTEELLRRLRREEIAGREVRLFKPIIDTRTSKDSVKSHNGTIKVAQTVESSWDIEDYIVSQNHPTDVVGIDEAQFFDSYLPLYVGGLLLDKKKIIVCGLDKDFATEGFGPMPTLMLMADRLDKLTAVCNKCGADDASFTQRLIDGKPAKFDGPTILVGGTESYEARCRDCFEAG